MGYGSSDGNGPSYHQLETERWENEQRSRQQRYDYDNASRESSEERRRALNYEGAGTGTAALAPAHWTWREWSLLVYCVLFGAYALWFAYTGLHSLQLQTDGAYP